MRIITLSLSALLWSLLIMTKCDIHCRYLIELYLFLVAVHLYANYSAVKALCLNTLNEDRLALILKGYMLNERVPEPPKVNREESVFLLGNPSEMLLIVAFVSHIQTTALSLYWYKNLYTLIVLRVLFSQGCLRLRHKNWRFICEHTGKGRHLIHGNGILVKVL